MILTNTKYMIAIFAAFAMLFAGVIVADTEDVDADTAPTYSVVYDVGGMLYTIDNGKNATVTLKSLEELGASTKAGTTFLNWTCSDKNDYAAGSTYIIKGEPVGGVITANFTAKIEATTYTATFLDSDEKTPLGTPVTGQTVTIKNDVITNKTPVVLNPADPEKKGYIFAGWVVKGTEDVIKTADLPKLTADVTYVAVYDIDYKITFVDGTTSYNTCVSAMVVPDLGVKEGFTFLGWFVGTEQVNFVKAEDGSYSTDYDFTADTTFTAKWEPINVYVTFTAGDFSKTVPVLYGDCVAMLALPEGFTAWDFDFDTEITEDVTIEAIPAPEPEPTGMDDPVIMTMVIIGAILLGAMVCGFAVLKKKGKIVVGLGPKNNSEGENKP